MYHQKESISRHRNLKIHDWNKFNESNIGYSKTIWLPEGVYGVEIESSKLMTLGPDISPFGQKWTSDWLMYPHSDSMSMFRMFKIKDWNMFNGSYIGYSKAKWSPEGVYWEEVESSKLMTLGLDISPFGQIWNRNYWHDIRKSQWVGIEIARSMTETCPMGKILASPWLIDHKKESIRQKEKDQN
ncbi:MAG: hypothetical protein ACRDCF_00020 [Mycoplasmoidaceae bacterium]